MFKAAPKLILMDVSLFGVLVRKVGYQRGVTASFGKGRGFSSCAMTRIPSYASVTTNLCLPTLMWRSVDSSERRSPCRQEWVQDPAESSPCRQEWVQDPAESSPCRQEWVQDPAESSPCRQEWVQDPAESSPCRQEWV